MAVFLSVQVLRLFEIPAWLGSLLVSLFIGAIIGMLIKHFIKWGIVAIVVVAILLTFGYVEPQYFTLVLNLMSPEVTSIWKDSVVTSTSGYASTVMFFLGLALAVWKT